LLTNHDPEHRLLDNDTSNGSEENGLQFPLEAVTATYDPSSTKFPVQMHGDCPACMHIKSSLGSKASLKVMEKQASHCLSKYGHSTQFIFGAVHFPNAPLGNGHVSPTNDSFTCSQTWLSQAFGLLVGKHLWVELPESEFIVPKQSSCPRIDRYAGGSPPIPPIIGCSGHFSPSYFC